MLGSWWFRPLFEVTFRAHQGMPVAKILLTDYQKVVTSVNVLRILQRVEQTNMCKKAYEHSHQQHRVLNLPVNLEMLV